MYTFVPLFAMRVSTIVSLIFSLNTSPAYTFMIMYLYIQFYLPKTHKSTNDGESRVKRIKKNIIYIQILIIISYRFGVLRNSANKQQMNIKNVFILVIAEL